MHSRSPSSTTTTAGTRSPASTTCPAPPPRTATWSARCATIEGTIHLPDLEPLAAGKFDKRAVEGRFANLKMHDSYTAFAQAFFTRLGIGPHGDGAKALRLLARIQAGHQIPTVDDLYK